MPLNSDLIVSSTTYKQLTVPSGSKKKTIKQFIESQGHTYHNGSAFIKITEPEVMSNDKIYVGTEDGITFLTGNDLKKAIKVGNKKSYTLDPNNHNNYTFYVEVKGHNKQVTAGTMILAKTESENKPSTAANVQSSSSTPVSPSNKRKNADPNQGSPKRKPTNNASVTSNENPSIKVSNIPEKTLIRGSGSYEEIQICFSYDSTYSMTPCIERVKRTVQQTIGRLLSASAKIEIAVIAHGDYDGPDHGGYLLKSCDFSTDQQKLNSFIQSIGQSIGYTFAECYEYVLHTARTTLSWKEKASKCLVMIGDAIPHEKGESVNYLNLDWRTEAALLKEANIKCYAVKCLAWSESKIFWRQLADLTGGYFLELAQFNAIPDFMIAITMRESEPEELENFSNEIRTREGGNLTRNMRYLFATLTGNTPEVDDIPEDLSAVEPGRFQILDVEEDEPIKELVVRNGAHFQKGKGFYQFMKPEEVQSYKEIVLMDKTTGDMFTGDRARELAGIKNHVKGKKQQPPPSDKWTMFIQSTSYNRKLISGTKFLYEAAKDIVDI